MEIISGRGSAMESVYGDYKWAWFFYRVSVEIISGRGSSIESVCLSLEMTTLLWCLSSCPGWRVLL